VNDPVIVSDMDGTLAAVETWRGVLAWIREQHPSPAARRFVAARLHKVVFVKSGLANVERFRAGWIEDQARLMADLPEPRLREMADWVTESCLWPARRQAAIDAVNASVAAARVTNPGARFILATGAYQQVGDAFGRKVGADLVLGTPVVVRNGRVTGELGAPVQSGEAKAAAVRAAAGLGEVVAAFGDSVADIPLLRMAARGVAVSPDKRLRREAATRGWDILEA
jgi:HAD superfamily phosphoserine phosphatase-like hydrolase